MLGHEPTELEWQAINNKKESADLKFVFVETKTGICCKPSCKLEVTNKEHIRILESENEALAAGYKPCKKCKPGGIKMTNEAWTDQMNAYMDTYYKEHITLKSLAEQFHGSPFHLQRVYKSTKGYTPTEYLQKVRIKEAKKLLCKTSETIETVGHLVGLHNTSYFITLFKNFEGITPKQYKKALEGR